MSSQRSFLRWLYLALAIAGAILPTLSNIDFAISYGPGFDIAKFISMANINPAAQSLSRDLFISASAVTIWIVSESKRLKMRNLWLVIISTFTIAFAFAAPLFLYLRELRLLEMEREGLDIAIE